MVSKLCTVFWTKGSIWKCLIEWIWVILKSWVYPVMSSRDAGKKKDAIKVCISSITERRNLVTNSELGITTEFSTEKFLFQLDQLQRGGKSIFQWERAFFPRSALVSKAISQIMFLLPASWSLWRNTLCIDVKALKKVTLSNVISLKWCKSYINDNKEVSILL